MLSSVGAQPMIGEQSTRPSPVDGNQPVLVLFADRDAATRELYREYLSAYAYTIEEASDGREALAKALADPPDLLHIQATGMALIDDVGEQVAVAHDGPAAGQRRTDHLLHQLGSAGHVHQHLRPK